MTNFKRSYLTFIILSLLAEEERYGFELSQIVKQRTTGQYELKPGALYPLLKKLKRDGLIQSRSQESPEGPDRKYLCLTPKGETILRQERREIGILFSFLGNKMV